MKFFQMFCKHGVNNPPVYSIFVVDFHKNAINTLTEWDFKDIIYN